MKKADVKNRIQISKMILLLGIVIIMSCLFSSCNDGSNDDLAGNCNEIGHHYMDATCTTPKTCSRCGVSSGKSLGHNYIGEASCTQPKTCIRCGVSGGSVLGHDYTEATCLEASKCNRCGIVKGTALGHSFSSSTCTSPQMCVRCDETKGAPLGHDFAAATCVLPKTCERCGDTDGNPLGHRYADDKCIRCEQIDPESLPVGLETLHVIDRSDEIPPYENYDYIDEIYVDSYGNKYTGAHWYYASYSSDPVFSIHSLQQEYSTLAGSIVVGNNHDVLCSFEIYVDDVLVYSVNDITVETEKIDFEISVKNAAKLKFKVIPHEFCEDIDLAIVNAVLEK